jgi:hypothetical protein
VYLAASPGSTKRDMHRIFMQNMRISIFEAYLRFLEWYSRCLRDALEHGLKNSNYGFIYSSEELMLECAMNMLYGKKWNGEGWVKAHKGYH